MNTNTTIIQKALTILLFFLGLGTALSLLDGDIRSALEIGIVAAFTLAGRSFFGTKAPKTRSRNTTRKSNSSRLTPEKEEHYRSKGLTKEEIKLFRSTMETAKNDIFVIEKNSLLSTKTKAILKRNETMPILKDYFKHLIEEPHRLHQANRFLYTYVPNLKELTTRYIDVDDHITKTKETYETLQECADAMDAVAVLIKDDYVAFMADELDSIDIEVHLANQAMNSHNEENQSVLEESDRV